MELILRFLIKKAVEGVLELEIWIKIIPIEVIILLLIYKTRTNNNYKILIKVIKKKARHFMF